MATRYDEPGRRDRAARAAVITAPGASAPRLPPSPNGSRTTTMRVPSSKTASTLTSRTMSGTPGSTSSTVSTLAPAAAASISRAPSRAASQTVSAISAVASGTLSRSPRARRARASSAAVKISSRSRSVGVRRMAARYCRRHQAVGARQQGRSFGSPPHSCSRRCPSGRSTSPPSSTPSIAAAPCRGLRLADALGAHRPRRSCCGQGRAPPPPGPSAVGRLRRADVGARRGTISAYAHAPVVIVVGCAASPPAHSRSSARRVQCCCRPSCARHRN